MRFHSPFRGCLRICGHDKSAPTAADGLPIMLLTPTKHPRTTPPGVGDRFIAPVSLYYQIYIFISPNTYLTIIEYTYSFHQICISVSSYTNIHIIKYAFPFPISWGLRICGHDKSAPISLLTVCENAMFEDENYSFISQKGGIYK